QAVAALVVGAVPRADVAAGSRPVQIGEQLQQQLGVYWFDEVAVEAGGPRAPAIVLLTPTGQRDDREPLAPRGITQAPADLVAVQPGQPDVQQHGVGRETLGGPQSRPTIVRDVGLVAL